MEISVEKLMNHAFNAGFLGITNMENYQQELSHDGGRYAEGEQYILDEDGYWLHIFWSTCETVLDNTEFAELDKREFVELSGPEDFGPVNIYGMGPEKDSFITFGDDFKVDFSDISEAEKKILENWGAA